MRISYLMTLQPLEPYFFGNEKTFSFHPKKPEDNRYFIKSERLPLQTTILGTLRYLLMPVKNADYAYSREEQLRNEAVVGAGSFCIEEAGQTFGAIAEISPVFLVKGQSKYVRTPFDHKTEVKDHYTPLGDYREVVTDQGTRWFSSDFHGKNGITDSYMNVKDGSLVDAQEIFFPVVRVGINKEKEDKGFFKRQFQLLHKDWSFGVYVTLETDRINADPAARNALTALENGTIAYLGQNKSAFAVQLRQEENGMATAISQHLRADILYCFGDTLAKENVYDKCLLAITKTRDYRAYATVFVPKENGQRFVGSVSKEARLYKLLCAGSVLIPDKQQDVFPCFRSADCEKIGFNVIIPYKEDCVE